MKRIIACILVVISLFFGVACKDKKEEIIQYEEGHIFLTEEMVQRIKPYMPNQWDAILLEKSDMSTETCVYYESIYGDKFVRAIGAISSKVGVSVDSFLVIEYVSENTAKEFFQERALDIMFVREKNVIAVDAYSSYVALGLAEPQANNYEVWYTKDNTVLLGYPTSGGLNKRFVLPEKTRRISGMAFEHALVEKVECNPKLISIGTFAFKNNYYLKNIILNDGLEVIQTKAFQDCLFFQYTVIPLSVEKIGQQAFTHGNIFCEVESKPDGWADNFYCEQAKVYWKGEWEYDENGNPVPIAEEVPPIDGGETV